MKEELKPSSQSRISTRCEIPKGRVLQWVVELFPEIAEDARLAHIGDNYNGSVYFEVDHTVQAPRPAGPILLAPLDGKDTVEKGS